MFQEVVSSKSRNFLDNKLTLPIVVSAQFDPNKVFVCVCGFETGKKKMCHLSSKWLYSNPVCFICVLSNGVRI